MHTREPARMLLRNPGSGHLKRIGIVNDAIVAVLILRGVDLDRGLGLSARAAMIRREASLGVR
jgi:hypothetical protein